MTMMHSWRWPGALLAVAVLAVVAVSGTAIAAPLQPPGGARLVIPGTGTTTAPFSRLVPTRPRALPGATNSTGSALLPGAAAAGSRLTRVTDPAARVTRSGAKRATFNDSYACDEYIDKSIQVNGDESGAQLLQVSYYGDVLCNFYLIEAAGVAGVIDRTAGHDGEVLSVGNTFDVQWDYYGYSTGGFALWSDTDPRARTIEIVDEVYLLSDIPWGSCEPLPGLRYLACDGLGSDLLHVVVGTGPIDTGLQDPPPLRLGAATADDCFLHTLIDDDGVRQIADGEHSDRVTFQAGVHCRTAGYTGSSQAVLHSIDDGQPGSERDLAAGATVSADSTADSTGEATVLERDDGGRKVRIIYSGTTTAPPGRTWAGCDGPDDEEYWFTQCSISGNTVNWVATGRLIDTELPKELHCQTAIKTASQQSADRKVTVQAGALASCEGVAGNADEITMEVRLVAKSGDQPEVEVGSPLPAWCATNLPINYCYVDELETTRAPDNDTDAAKLLTAVCDPDDSTTKTTFRVTVTNGRYEHPGGWSEPIEVTDSGQDYICLPR